ncbi:hypothetical protein J3A83DRAFT_4375548 [Scleroderma citrinum]
MFSPALVFGMSMGTRQNVSPGMPLILSQVWAGWGMATPHQQELLDFQMNDSNFLKMVWMSLVLKKKIKSTQKSLATVTEAFDNLNTQAPEHLWQLWSEQESKALTDWLVDSWAMDIFDVQLERAPTVNPIEMDLISQQDEEPQGSATWIAKALKVEELQIALEIDSQQMNAMTTKVQQLSIAWHQDQLHSQLEGLVALMGWFLENDWEDELLPDCPGTTPGEGDGVDEIENLIDHLQKLGLSFLAEQEPSLR